MINLKVDFDDVKSTYGGIGSAPALCAAYAGAGSAILGRNDQTFDSAPELNQ